MYGMYMTRITTANYGTWLLHLVGVNILMSVAFTVLFSSPGYIAICIVSGVLLSLMELGMLRRGMRTSRMLVYGRQVGPAADSFIKGFAEGPGLCVPALFGADQLYAGHYLVGILVPCMILLLWSLYWAFRERIGLEQLKEGESPIINRRWMNKPEMVFFVGMVNLGVGIWILWGMEVAHRLHIVYFLLMFFLVLQVFFLVHARYGVRRIDKYFPETKTYAPDGVRFSVLGYTYDSIFEMAMLNAPYYLIPYSLGLVVISS